jgi:hypothetical protein
MEKPQWILWRRSTSLPFAMVTREPQHHPSTNKTSASNPSLLLPSLLHPTTSIYRKDSSTTGLLSLTSTDLDSPSLSTEVLPLRSVTNPRTTDRQGRDTDIRSSMEGLRCMEGTRRRRWVLLKTLCDTSTTSARV